MLLGRRDLFRMALGAAIAGQSSPCPRTYAQGGFVSGNALRLGESFHPGEHVIVRTARLGNNISVTLHDRDDVTPRSALSVPNRLFGARVTAAGEIV